MKVKSNDDWYKFLTTDLDKTYEKWVSYAKTKSLYNTGITPADSNAFNLLRLQSG